MHPIILTKQMKALVVGGGRAAYVKLQRLLKTYTDVTCISVDFCPQITESNAICITKDFYALDTSFFDDFDLIYLSLPYPENTEDEKFFSQVIDHLTKTKKLFSVSSKPELGNFITPATRCDDNLIVSVSTSGESPTRSVALADSLIKIAKDTFLDG